MRWSGLCFADVNVDVFQHFTPFPLVRCSFGRSRPGAVFHGVPIKQGGFGRLALRVLLVRFTLLYMQCTIYYVCLGPAAVAAPAVDLSPSRSCLRRSCCSGSGARSAGARPSVRGRAVLPARGPLTPCLAVFQRGRLPAWAVSGCSPALRISPPGTFSRSCRPCLARPGASLPGSPAALAGWSWSSLGCPLRSVLPPVAAPGRLAGLPGRAGGRSCALSGTPRMPCRFPGGRAWQSAGRPSRPALRTPWPSMRRRLAGRVGLPGASLRSVSWCPADCLALPDALTVPGSAGRMPAPWVPACRSGLWPFFIGTIAGPGRPLHKNCGV